MKIAISAVDPNLDSEVYPRFGRSRYFIIVDPETMQYESLTNPNIEAAGGAGISTAQLVFKKGASVIITGTIGPKAHQALATAGVHMWTGVSGPIRDAIANYKAGKMPVEAGVTLDTGSAGGAGMRKGAGMGRGMGCGGGRAMRMGSGRGSGADRVAPRDWNTEPWSDRVRQTGGPGELSILKQQADQLAEELSRIRQRIEQIERQ